jgi:hypothetical protein
MQIATRAFLLAQPGSDGDYVTVMIPVRFNRALNTLIVVNYYINMMSMIILLHNATGVLCCAVLSCTALSRAASILIHIAALKLCQACPALLFPPPPPNTNGPKRKSLLRRNRAGQKKTKKNELRLK